MAPQTLMKAIGIVTSVVNSWGGGSVNALIVAFGTSQKGTSAKWSLMADAVTRRDATTGHPLDAAHLEHGTLLADINGMDRTMNMDKSKFVVGCGPVQYLDRDNQRGFFTGPDTTAVATFAVSPCIPRDFREGGLRMRPVEVFINHFATALQAERKGDINQSQFMLTEARSGVLAAANVDFTAVANTLALRCSSVRSMGDEQLHYAI